jgi:hypothetical protein
MVWQGVQYWANWVNLQGGLIYNNSFHDVEIFTHDASSLDTSLQSATITSVYLALIETFIDMWIDFMRYQELVTVDGSNMCLVPYTATRAAPSIAV